LGKISKVLNICAPRKEENTSGEGGGRQAILYSVRKYYAADNVFILPINLAGNTSTFGQAI
jgi:hypothetical protein